MYQNILNYFLFNQNNAVKISVTELVLSEMANNPYFNDNRGFYINRGLTKDQTSKREHVFIDGISKNCKYIGIQAGHYNIELLGITNNDIILNKYNTPGKNSVLFLKHKNQIIITGVNDYVNNVNIIHGAWFNGYNIELVSDKFNTFVFEYNLKMQSLHNNLTKIGIIDKTTRDSIIKEMVKEKTPNPYPLKKTN